MNYSEKIKLLREQKEITQAELAEALDCSRQIIVRWESGSSVPSTYYAKKLANFFGLSVDELMDDADISDNKNIPLSQYGNVKRKNNVFPIAIISILSFIPIIIYYIFKVLTEAIRQRLILEGFTAATDYRNVTDIVTKLGAILAFAFIAILAAVWIALLFSKFVSFTEKYERYEALRFFNIGNIFILMNTVYLIYNELSVVSGLWFGFIYFASFSIAMCIEGFFMGLFYLFGKKYILFESSASLKRVKIIFFIIRAINLSALLFFIIYAYLTRHSSVAFVFLIVFILFIDLSIGTEIAYFVIRRKIKK